MPPVNQKALREVLLCVSEMVCELPWLMELDINPLIVDEKGAIAADARIVVEPHLRDQRRPLRAHGDLPLPGPFDPGVADERRHGRSPSARSARKMPRWSRNSSRACPTNRSYYRFMDTLRELTPTMLVRFTQIDYDREMALVGTLAGDEGKETQIGVARYVVNPDGESVEFALAVGDAWQK